MADDGDTSPLDKLADLRLHDERSVRTANMADATFPLQELPPEIQLMIWNEVVRSPGIHFVRLEMARQYDPEVLEREARSRWEPGVYFKRPQNPVIPTFGLSLPDDMLDFYDDDPSTHDLSSSIRTCQLRTTTTLARAVVDGLRRDAADQTSKDHSAGWRLEPNATAVGWKAEEKAKERAEADPRYYPRSKVGPIPQVPVVLMNVKTDIVLFGPNGYKPPDPNDSFQPAGLPDLDSRPENHNPMPQTFKIHIRHGSRHPEGWSKSLYCNQYPQMHDVRQLGIYHTRQKYTYHNGPIYETKEMYDYDEHLNWAPVHFPFLEVVWLVDFRIRPNTERLDWKVPRGAKTFQGNQCLFVEVRPQDLAMWSQEDDTAHALECARSHTEAIITPREVMDAVSSRENRPSNHYPDFWLKAKSPADGSPGPDPCKVEYKVLACVRTPRLAWGGYLTSPTS